jgi:hypothetical protein
MNSDAILQAHLDQSAERRDPSQRRGLLMRMRSDDHDGNIALALTARRTHEPATPPWIISRVMDSLLGDFAQHEIRRRTASRTMIFRACAATIATTRSFQRGRC